MDENQNRLPANVGHGDYGPFYFGPERLERSDTFREPEGAGQRRHPPRRPADLESVSALSHNMGLKAVGVGLDRSFVFTSETSSVELMPFQ